MSGLATTEATRLAELEATIARGLAAFIEVGCALLEIRDSRLYRASHATFEHYCRKRWGMGRRYANRTIEAAGIAGLVGPNGPTNEAQARELVPLKNDERAVLAAWRDAQAIAEELGKPMSAKIIHRSARAQIARIKREVRQEQVACADCGTSGVRLVRLPHPTRILFETRRGPLPASVDPDPCCHSCAEKRWLAMSNDERRWRLFGGDAARVEAFKEVLRDLDGHLYDPGFSYADGVRELLATLEGKASGVASQYPEALAGLDERVAAIEDAVAGLRAYVNKAAEAIAESTNERAR